MKKICRQGIYYHINEPDLHIQNPGEGVIRGVRRKWYLTTVKKKAPRQIWDYGVI